MCVFIQWKDAYIVEIKHSIMNNEVLRYVKIRIFQNSFSLSATGHTIVCGLKFKPRRTCRNEGIEFQDDFLVFQKRMLQNYQKIMTKCFRVADSRSIMNVLKNHFILVKDILIKVVDNGVQGTLTWCQDTYTMVLGHIYHGVRTKYHGVEKQ